MFVREWMTRQLITVEPTNTLVEASQLMAKHRIRRLLAVDSHGLQGIVSDRDVRSGLADGIDRVSLCMARDIITISPANALEEAAAKMVLHRIGGLPVLEEEKLVGIITEVDIFRGMIHLMGYARPGFRVEVDVPHEVHFSQMLSLIEREPAQLTSFITGPDMGPDHHRRCAFRLDSLDPALPDKIEGLMRQLNIKVLDIRRSG